MEAIYHETKAAKFEVMMTYLRNEKGIALVMVLVLSLIALAMVSSLLFMITKETMMSGYQKMFRTAEEASIGGTEVFAEYVANRGALTLTAFSIDVGGCNCGDIDNLTDNTEIVGGARTCRCDKLCNPTGDNPTVNWPLCDENAVPAGVQISLNPSEHPDITATVTGSPNNYTVYAKIVNTVQGNSDVGGIVGSGQLGGGGVVTANAGIVVPPHNPYLYRMEIEAFDIGNPRERSRFTALYAF